MSNSDSISNNSDADRDNGLGDGGLEATQGFTSGASLDITDAYDSLTRSDLADVTAAFDASGRPISGSASASHAGRNRFGATGSLIGVVIGGYRIVALLGQGGMGRVFRADDSSGRPVAIKLLSPDLARSSEALARFKQEGLIASQINHFRCVFVHRVDEDAGTPFIAMELMTGLTLKDLVTQKGPLPYSNAAKLILQCIEGLIEAHSRGMIHRDIKPANCYLDSSGNVKIGDFGLARSLVGNSELTQTGAFIGTPLFASPEQLLGQEIDIRSDIYSLTATLYFLLAGKAPFESPHAAQVIARIASSDPPPFSSVDVEVPVELERIVMKGLSRDPAKRYQTFGEMQSDLLSLMAPKPETASLARRIIAWLADSFLISVLFGLLALLVLPALADSILAKVFGAASVFAYYFVCEAIFSTSLGKAALRIRVADVLTGRRASVQKIFTRALSYSLIGLAFELVLHAAFYLSGSFNSGIVQGMVSVLSIPPTYLSLYSTWRYSKKRQLLHDWLSGTECLISVPPVVQVTQLELPDYKPATIETQELPYAELGGFRIIGQFSAPDSDGSVRWFSAEDPQLDRAVWIAISHQAEIDFEGLQCTKDPSTRLRFIEQGFTEHGERWFAYVAPEGIPLQECLGSGVHLAWPVTNLVFRQMIAHFHSVAAGGNQLTIAKLSDWWIDRAGRVSIVSLASPLISEAAVDYKARDQQNSINYQQLLQTVCRLALPRNHKLRKPFCKVISPRCEGLLAREALPSLRSIKFCESVASGKYTPALKVLESEVAQLNKGSHCVNSKARFLNAVLSLAFSIPVIFLAAILIAMPAIKFVLDSRDDLQSLITLETIASSPEQRDDWWQGASDQQQQYWTSVQGKSQINKVTANTRDRLRGSYKRLGRIEQTIVSNFPFEGTLLEPPVFDLGITSEMAEPSPEKDRDLEIQIDAGRIRVGATNTPRWNRGYLERAVRLVEDEGDPSGVSTSDSFSVVQLSVYLLIGLAVWTWLTFGGMSTRITGICFVARDGTRMGIFRSGLRALVIFLPVILLFALIAFWDLQTVNDIWWTTQLKRVLLISPIIYVASTLIWSNRTVADILSGTTAIPR